MKLHTARFSTVALASLLATAAVPFATAAVAADQADTSKADTMKSDQPATDTWITTKVKSELATTDGVKSMDISVKTVDGIVTLTGVLANDTAVKKAVAAAQSIKGVKSVDSSGLKARS